MTPRSVWRVAASGAAALATALALACAVPAASAASTDYQAEDATISQGVVESNHAGRGTLPSATSGRTPPPSPGPRPPTTPAWSATRSTAAATC